MSSFQAEPENFVELLQIVRDGSVCSLKSGEYKGPFTIDRSITICGTGADTVIFAVDEPALVVKVPGVRLENLAIARTVGGDTGEIVLSATREASPICKSVKLTGVAPNVQWERESWDIPTVLDFGEIPINRQVERSWELQVGAPGKISSDVDWLRVQETHLYPGIQNLHVVINSKDIPSGTLLSGSLFLEAEDGKRIIKIIGLIKAHQSTDVKAIYTISNKKHIEDWGYRFVSERAIDKLIGDVENRSEKSSDWRQRDGIQALMSYLIGDSPVLFYVHRKEVNQRSSEEEMWELIIATDRDDFELPTKLKQRDKTLRLLAIVRSEDGEGGLKICDAGLVELPRGREDGFCLTCYLRLIPNPRLGVSALAIKRMKKLPFWSDRHIPTDHQLQVWNTFLEIEERLAKARQFCVSFRSHNGGADTRQVTFEIDVESASLDGSSENYLDENDFWQRAKQARNEDLSLFDSDMPPTSLKKELPKVGGCRLGSITEVDSKGCKIRLRLDVDLVERITQGRYQLPHKGFLYFEAAGDIYQINQKKKALENLRLGRTQNTYLSKFLFDASQARVPRKIIQLQPQDLLKRDANPDQIAAVAAVLSAPDMVLIQGPPGTGKTTVIAEICYQVALRGGKTLIASQANLAVDNALSRLVHSPVIRALRKGKADKVQEEGQAFLEDNVISTWLQNTAGDCEKSLSKHQENVSVFRKLLIPSQQFTVYLESEEEFQQQQKQLQQDKVNLEENCRNQEKIYQETDAKRCELESLIVGLENLLNSDKSVNWEAPEVTNFLPRLQAYTKGNALVEDFVVNVRTAISQTTELGFVRPGYGAFGLAVWLQETVANEISQLGIVLNDVKDAATATSEVAEMVEVFRQNSASLNEAKKNYQHTLANQQSLQSQIKHLESRRSELDFIINAVKEWKSTANSRLYKILQDCRQSGELLKDDLIGLPAGLWMLARSLSLPLVPNNYKVNKIDQMPNWGQLKNALSYEVDGGFVDRRGKQFSFSEFLHQTLNQPLMVLSASDRTQWREIAQQFINYPHLKPPQRRPLVEKTQQFLSKMEQVYGASWEANNLDSTLNRIVQELLEEILTNARKCVMPVNSETNQQLQHLQEQLNEIQKKGTNFQQQISAAQYQVETAQQQIDLKLNRVIELLQKLLQQPNLPQQLRIVTEQYLAKQSSIWENSQQFLTQVDVWQSCVSQLTPLISSLKPFSILQIIKSCLDEQIYTIKQENENARSQLQEYQKKLDEIDNIVQLRIPENLIKQRNWWHKAWETIPDRFKPDIPSTELFNLEFLRTFKIQFDSWQKEFEEEQTYLNRYQNFVQDWIEKLRNPSAQDQNELKQIYIDNANVIGITCVQAAKGDFSKEFPSFDVVIVDEVSKCTPPELLIPALKGRKLVLVGDHRQLPPMLRDETIEDIAEQLGSSKDDLSFIKNSLFKIQFESADDRIKRMLTIQYRMHPQIMGAINQFYEHRLNCGILEPDTKRAHNLAGKIIQENQHLLWVTTPVGQGFAEEKEGTSRCNPREVDAIERLCEQIEAVWLSQVSKGEPKKEIGIITFYGAQLRAIKERMECDKFPSLNIRTGTVDIFQGMERPVIIVSTVCNNSRGDIGFAKEPERVNVAFSRAQELLVVVGCHDLFTQQSGKVGGMYQEVSKVVRRYGGFVDVSSVLC